MINRLLGLNPLLPVPVQTLLNEVSQVVDFGRARSVARDVLTCLLDPGLEWF
jgi:hypothetical protein